jgi:hypothetical protein
MDLRAQNWGVNRIARKLGIGSGTLRRIVAEAASAWAKPMKALVTKATEVTKLSLP